jgi:zeaxanthin glucosyltransferase
VRIAFLTLPAAGHINPITALARTMRDRGHEVFFLAFPDCEAPIRTAGLPFHPFAERQFPVGSRREWEARLAKLRGLAGLRFTIQVLTGWFEAVVNEVPAILLETDAEAIVADELLYGAHFAAGRVGLPLIHVASALPSHYHENVPLSVLGWPYKTGWVARFRNRAAYSVVTRLLDPLRVLVLEHSRRHGLPVDINDPNAHLSKLAQISQTPAEFDFPNSGLPPWFHHTGPFHDGRGRAPANFPWDRLTGKPLIYASMGTLQNGFAQVFRTIAQATGDLGCQVVMSTGENLTAEELGPLGSHCIAVEYAPQLELLPRATLCITHAGLNTALESLAAGVPMVAVPITNDQPGVAARIAHTRTGLVVPFRKLNAARLRHAVRQVLDDNGYYENAQRLKTAIQAANGLARAADIIEQSLGVQRKYSTASA